MSIRAAYLGIIIIWATTPLAIQWSGEGVGYRFGVTSRMVIGVFATLALLFAVRGKLSTSRSALGTYVAGGLGIYFAMTCVYWSAQYIPSGWVSIVFGLSPLITGILAAFILNEDALALHKLVGIGLGFIGLLITFRHGLVSGTNTLLGILGVLIGTCCHCLSAVCIKKINADVSGISATAGSLIVAVSLYLLTWFVTYSEVPNSITIRAASAIIYLGTVGTAIGFALYYFVLKNMEVSRVALITLITPVCAIALGHLLNGEPINTAVIAGAGCILLGLMCYEFGTGLSQRLASRSAI